MADQEAIKEKFVALQDAFNAECRKRFPDKWLYPTLSLQPAGGGFDVVVCPPAAKVRPMLGWQGPETEIEAFAYGFLATLQDNTAQIERRKRIEYPHNSEEYQDGILSVVLSDNTVLEERLHGGYRWGTLALCVREGNGQWHLPHAIDETIKMMSDVQSRVLGNEVEVINKREARLRA